MKHSLGRWVPLALFAGALLLAAARTAWAENVQPANVDPIGQWTETAEPLCDDMPVEEPVNPTEPGGLH
jgi:hypothetical protein